MASKRVLAGVGGVIVVLALFAGAVGAAVYYYQQYAKTKALLFNQQEVQKAEAEALIDKVGKIYELPSGETPTVATVVDKEKLKDQPFFSLAENGDKLLIYAAAKKAILYRTGTNKVIDVMPVNLGESVPTPTVVPVRVGLMNGTPKAGYTLEMEKILKGKVSGIEISTKANAKGVYEKTLVVDLSGKNAEVASQIAKVLAGEVAQLPSGEKTLDVDVLVIGGAATESAEVKQ